MDSGKVSRNIVVTLDLGSGASPTKDSKCIPVGDPDAQVHAVRHIHVLSFRRERYIPRGTVRQGAGRDKYFAKEADPTWNELELLYPIVDPVADIQPSIWRTCDLMNWIAERRWNWT